MTRRLRGFGGPALLVLAALGTTPAAGQETEQRTAYARLLAAHVRPVTMAVIGLRGSRGAPRGGGHEAGDRAAAYSRPDSGQNPALLGVDGGSAKAPEVSEASPYSVRDR